eukprot:CFRG7519T1
MASPTILQDKDTSVYMSGVPNRAHLTHRSVTTGSSRNKGLTGSMYRDADREGVPFEEWEQIESQIIQSRKSLSKRNKHTQTDCFYNSTSYVNDKDGSDEDFFDALDTFSMPNRRKSADVMLTQSPTSVKRDELRRPSLRNEITTKSLSNRKGHGANSNESRGIKILPMPTSGCASRNVSDDASFNGNVSINDSACHIQPTETATLSNCSKLVAPCAAMSWLEYLIEDTDTTASETEITKCGPVKTIGTNNDYVSNEIEHAIGAGKNEVKDSTRLGNYEKYYTPTASPSLTHEEKEQTAMICSRTDVGECAGDITKILKVEDTSLAMGASEYEDGAIFEETMDNYEKYFSAQQAIRLARAHSKQNQKALTISGSSEQAYDKRKTLAYMFSSDVEKKEEERTLAQRRRTCDRIQIDLNYLFASKIKPTNTKSDIPYAKAGSSMTETRAATVMQAVWRGRQSRMLYKKIVRRGYAVHELLDTEVSYVRLLRMIQLWYIKPLTAAANKSQEYLAPVITLDEIDKIFSNAQDLYYYHRDLLLSMQERFDKWHHEQLLGDIFLPMADTHLDAYIQYVNDYDRSIETLSALRLQPAMKRFLEERRESRGIKEDLSDLLITPVQRIPRYSMLLEQILKYTPVKHPDAANLKNALATIKRVADTINERKRAKQLVEQLATKVVGCPEPIAISSRYLITVCDMLDVCKSKVRRLFLCNDCILITTATSHRNLFGTNKTSTREHNGAKVLSYWTSFHFSNILYLENTDFIEVPSSAIRARKAWKQVSNFKDAKWIIRFKQTLESEVKVWEFLAPTDDMKELWRSKIQSLKDEEIKDEQRRRKIERMKEIVGGVSDKTIVEARNQYWDRYNKKEEVSKQSSKMLQMVTDPELLADATTRAEGLKALETKVYEIETDIAVETNILDGMDAILQISRQKDQKSRKVEKEISDIEKKIKVSIARLETLRIELDNHNKSIEAIRSTKYTADTKLVPDYDIIDKHTDRNKENTTTQSNNEDVSAFERFSTPSLRGVADVVGGDSSGAYLMALGESTCLVDSQCLYRRISGRESLPDLLQASDEDDDKACSYTRVKGEGVEDAFSAMAALNVSMPELTSNDVENEPYDDDCSDVTLTRQACEQLTDVKNTKQVSERDGCKPEDAPDETKSAELQKCSSFRNIFRLPFSMSFRSKKSRSSSLSKATSHTDTKPSPRTSTRLKTHDSTYTAKSCVRKTGDVYGKDDNATEGLTECSDSVKVGLANVDDKGTILDVGLGRRTNERKRNTTIVANGDA